MDVEQGSENNTTFVTAAIAALRSRIGEAGHGYDTNPDALKILLDSPNILGPALAQAIQEMIWHSTLSEMDEEARTAGLFSHLVSNLNWFAVMASWTNQIYGEDRAKERAPCDLFFAHQPRHVEADRGADFGIATRLENDNVRIVLYQAKRVDFGNHVSVHRRVKKESFADKIIKTCLTSNISIELVEKHSKRLLLRNLHQVHRLEIWRNYGIRLISDLTKSPSPNFQWCRYVFWGDASDQNKIVNAPIVMSSKSVFDIVQNNFINKRQGNLNRKRIFNISVTGSDFGESILKNTGDDMIVPKDLAKKLLGKFKKLGLPDFLAIDDTGNGDGAEFWKELFSESGLTVVYAAGSRSSAKSSPPKVLFDVINSNLTT